MKSVQLTVAFQRGWGGGGGGGYIGNFWKGVRTLSGGMSYDFNLKGGHGSHKMKLIGILYFLKKYIPHHAGAMSSNDITRFT